MMIRFRCRASLVKTQIRQIKKVPLLISASLCIPSYDSLPVQCEISANDCAKYAEDSLVKKIYGHEKRFDILPSLERLNPSWIQI